MRYTTVLLGLFTAAVSIAAALPSRSQGPGEVRESAWVEVHSSRVRLIGGRHEGGLTHYLAGVEIVLADGWKTYWRMPGDSGVPPTFDWSQSQNLAKAEVLYPAPQRMPEAGGEAIGYKGSVVLPIRITPKESGAPVLLKLALELGLCRDICIPATVNLSLALAPQGEGAPPPELTAALERVPRPNLKRRRTDPELKRVRIVEAAEPVRLEIEGIFQGSPDKADLFIEAPDGLFVPMPKKQPGPNDGVVRFETDLSADLMKDLRGKRLTLTLVGENGATETRWTFP